MAFWNRRRPRAAPKVPRRIWGRPDDFIDPPPAGAGITGVTSFGGVPEQLTPRLDESKTRVYDDELDEDWRDPITEPDDEDG